MRAMGMYSAVSMMHLVANIEFILMSGSKVGSARLEMSMRKDSKIQCLNEG